MCAEVSNLHGARAGDTDLPSALTDVAEDAFLRSGGCRHIDRTTRQIGPKLDKPHLEHVGRHELAQRVRFGWWGLLHHDCFELLRGCNTEDSFVGMARFAQHRVEDPGALGSGSQPTEFVQVESQLSQTGPVSRSQRVGAADRNAATRRAPGDRSTRPSAASTSRRAVAPQTGATTCTAAAPTASTTRWQQTRDRQSGRRSVQSRVVRRERSRQCAAQCS